MYSVLLDMLMTFTGMLIVVGLLLLLVDLFVLSSKPRLVAFALFSIAAAAFMPRIPQLRFMVALGTWVLLMLFHYYIWRYASDFVRSPRIQGSYMRGLVGHIGRIEDVRRRKMLRLDDRRWRIMNPQRLAIGQVVRVVAIEKDGLRVAPIQGEEDASYRQHEA